MPLQQQLGMMQANPSSCLQGISMTSQCYSAAELTDMMRRASEAMQTGNGAIVMALAGEYVNAASNVAPDVGV